MPYYHLLPTVANRALAEYEEAWKEFNLEIIATARGVSCHGSMMFLFLSKTEQHLMPGVTHVYYC